MLQAKDRKGRLISLTSLSKKEIINYKNQELFCPACHQPVRLKLDKSMVPHFVHIHKSPCRSLQRGEGPYHILGKKQLYQWFKQQKIPVVLEAYLSNLKQQPDLLVMFRQRIFAIEFQCSRIPIQRLQQRIRGYKKRKIHPLWILGAHKMRRQAKNKLHIDRFTRQLIHRFSKSSPKTLYYFCPKQQQFFIFQHIYFTSSDEAFGVLKSLPLKQMTFLDLFQSFSFSTTTLYEHWKEEKEIFRLRPLNYKYGQEHRWQQWLYTRKTHVNYLPSVIYLPISSQYLLKTSPWNWQSRLCLDLLVPIKVGQNFSLRHCYQVLNKHFYSSKYFPLLPSFEDPLKQYLNLLITLRFLRRVSPNTFQKTKKFKFFSHVEEAIAYDRNLLDYLIEQRR